MAKNIVQATRARRETNAAAAAKKLRETGYLHSYGVTYDAVLNTGFVDSLDSKIKLENIINYFVAKKKNDLQNFAVGQLKFDSVEDFLKDITEGLKAQSSDSINDSLKAAISNIFDDVEQLNWEEQFSELARQFIADADLSDIIWSGKNKEYVQTRLDNYNAGKELLSPSAVKKIQTAFIKDLKANSDTRKLGKTFDVILSGADDRAKAFAALAGIGQLKQKGGKLLDTSEGWPGAQAMQEQLFTILGIDGRSPSNSGLKSHVLGKIQELLAEINLSGYFEAAFGKGFANVSGDTADLQIESGTVKRDIEITLPTDFDFGISVKSIVRKPYGSSGEMMNRFKLQDITLSNLKNLVRGADMGLGQVVNDVYYLILNEQFQNSVSQVTGGIGNETYTSRQFSSSVMAYLDKYFTALAAYWIGTAMDDSSSQRLMEIGIVYDPSQGIVIPAYQLLESILKSSGGTVGGQIRVDIYGSFSDATARSYYYSKIASESGRKTKNYQNEIVTKGANFGNQASKNIQLSVVGIFLERFLGLQALTI